jgi:citrate lyase subunit beta/citryl-CoA lyase
MTLPLRSWLFAPANKPAIVAKALASAADAVIIDLEDAVPLAEKLASRKGLSGLIDGMHAALFVRINALSTRFALDDIVATVALPVAGIMLPKSERAQDVEIVHWLLDQLDAGSAHAKGCEIVPLIETAAGVAHAQEIASASARVRRLAFGAGDFTLDLAMHWSRDEQELMPARNAIAVASRLAGLEPPIDAVWVEIADAQGMDRSAERARDHGFQGKMCIHPAQVASVNATYRPSPEALAKARNIVEAFDAAEASGVGAIQIDGRMVDYPVVAAARRTLTDGMRGEVKGEKEVSTPHA